MIESINAEFEAYVKAELGDIAAVSEGRFISPKIQNYFKVWNHQQAKIIELQFEVEALRKDAERYQFYRDGCCDANVGVYRFANDNHKREWISGKTLDKITDATIKGQAKTPPQVDGAG